MPRVRSASTTTVKAYLDYSPTTGQGYDACGTVVRNRTLDKAFDDAPASARSALVSQLDAAPGKLVESRGQAMVNRLNTHREKFCTPSEASVICAHGWQFLGR